MLTDRDIMLIIRSKNESCVFYVSELALWLQEALPDLSENAAYLRAKRAIKRLPVELLTKNFYRLLIVPEEVSGAKKKVVEKKPAVKLGNGDTCRQILEYFNQKTGKNYKGKPADLLKINARLREGHTLEDFKKVIDLKVEEWSGTSFAKFLRPETLFGTKFEGYLQQGGAIKGGKAEEMSNYDFSKYLPNKGG